MQWLTTAVETFLNGVLRLDPVTRERLAKLSGHTIKLEIMGLGQTLYLQPGAAGVRVRGDCPESAALTLRATPPVLMRLAAGGAAAGSGLELEGDALLAHELRALLAGMDLDWEEPLAWLLGDLPAHRIGLLARTAQAWRQAALSSLIHNHGEYLQYERRDLPPRHQVLEYIDAVDRLRDDLDRLEARIIRLQRHAVQR